MSSAIERWQQREAAFEALAEARRAADLSGRAAELSAAQLREARELRFALESHAFALRDLRGLVEETRREVTAGLAELGAIF